MIISSSTVAMKAERSYSSIRQEERIELIERPDEAVKLDISKESQSLVEQMKEYQAEKQSQQMEQQKGNLQRMLENQKAHSANYHPIPEGTQLQGDAEVEMLKRILEALRRALKSGKLTSFKDEVQRIKTEYNSEYRASTNSNISLTLQKGSGGIVNLSGQGSSGSNAMTRTTVISGFFAETEHTAFESTGIAKTADGREISFGVTVEMSRGFCERYETLAQEDYICVDPLVINLDSNVAKVSDMKFLFDIDSDGKDDEISFAGNGSGFITLDKNGDGKVNNGSELFGTKSGDGFADLAQYDKDGNGWIDEADDVFDDLRIWTKDADGNDRLIRLLDADVGAIYLGNANTEFSLNNMLTNDTNGVIRKTGVYLKESGGVGTVQHVDLAV